MFYTNVKTKHMAQRVCVPWWGRKKCNINNIKGPGAKKLSNVGVNKKKTADDKQMVRDRLPDRTRTGDGRHKKKMIKKGKEPWKECVCRF